ncbi:hypothetical protein SLS53_007946 [Cytospora paraplurivora]|uniref:Lysophospholipase A n=1 Tax=Cytospora paraplurivora TaxID=2898453 RepID=A0AAN9TZL3_9PEZI
MPRIAFGDSYTYAQGTLGYANSTFIGSNLNFSYTPEQLLSDRIIQEDVISTAERGPNWIEDITNCGVKEGLTDPRTCNIQLWDFAFGGADISSEYLPLHHNWSVQLVNQTEQFLLYGQPVLKDFVDPKKTLVAIWIGINDIGDSRTLDVYFPDFYEELISTLFEQAVHPVYEAGYKNFLFMKLPPLNRTPGNLVRAAGPSPNVTQIGWWDDTLDRHASAFANKNKDVTSLVFDSNTFLNYVLDHPAEYDIKNTTAYCPEYNQPLPVEQYGCLPLKDYFWYNNGHMTSHTHKILADELEKFLVASSK